VSDRDCASLAILKKPSQHSVRHCKRNLSEFRGAAIRRSILKPRVLMLQSAQGAFCERPVATVPSP
jgi:hypothetical protein